MVDINIGVEVRRLNQQFTYNGVTKGLEEDCIPLKQLIQKELEK